MFYYLLWLILYIIIRAGMMLFGGLRIEGRQNVPRSGGVIIAPNHLSHADPPLIGVATPRFPYYVATDELFDIPLLGTIARWMRGYPIRQDSPDRAALRKTEQLLKRGEAVVIFPEGHESLNGELQDLQGGTILLALRAGVPVVPVGILNTGKLVPPRTYRLRRPKEKIEIRFGQPISPEALSGGHKGHAAIGYGTQVLRHAILELIGHSPEETAAAGSVIPVSGPGDVRKQNQVQTKPQ